MRTELDDLRRELAETKAVLSDLVHERYGSDAEWVSATVISAAHRVQ